MKFGLIGLGRKDGNIARRLMRSGHETVVCECYGKVVSDFEGRHDLR